MADGGPHPCPKIRQGLCCERRCRCKPRASLQPLRLHPHPRLDSVGTCNDLQLHCLSSALPFIVSSLAISSFKLRVTLHCVATRCRDVDHTVCGSSQRFLSFADAFSLLPQSGLRPPSAAAPAASPSALFSPPAQLANNSIGGAARRAARPVAAHSAAQYVLLGGVIRTETGRGLVKASSGEGAGDAISELIEALKGSGGDRCGRSPAPGKGASKAWHFCTPWLVLFLQLHQKFVRA